MARCARAIALVGLICAGAASAQDAVSYRVEVALDWKASEAGPDNPHWSRLIAVAHSGRYGLFADGDTASSGLALVATNGRVSVLRAELAEVQRRRRAGEIVELPGIATGVGRFAFDIALTDRFDQVSFATMLAPSPDWFTGVSGVDLKPGDVWLDQVSVALWPWDAGADSGPDFEGPNVPTQPRQSVRLLTHPAFLTEDGMRPIGRATFSRRP